MPLLLEHWKPVIGFEEQYSVSNVGRVWSERNKREMKLHINCEGYPTLTLSLRGQYGPVNVHRVVANAFLRKAAVSDTVNHIDGHKCNNRVSNLEFVSITENVRHAIRTGLRPAGRKPGTCAHKLNEILVREIRHLEGKESSKEVARRYNLAHTTVLRIWRRSIWCSVE